MTEGASVIFINPIDEVLLYLRDDKSTIPYPNSWDLPGGHIEEGETPWEAALREVKEELGIELNPGDRKEFNHFGSFSFDYGNEEVYISHKELDLPKINLTEGQKLGWFSQEEVKRLPLAFKVGKILEELWNG